MHKYLIYAALVSPLYGTKTEEDFLENSENILQYNSMWVFLNAVWSNTYLF